MAEAKKTAEKGAENKVEVSETEENKVVEETVEETVEKPVEKKPYNPMDDKVTIRLFKDNDKYKDDVTVSVNGKAYRIKRGKDVQIPRFVAEVLDASMRQDSATAEHIDKEVNGYNSIIRVLE